MIISMKNIMGGISALFNGVDYTTNHGEKLNPNLWDTKGKMTRFLGDFIVEPTFVVSRSVVNSSSYDDVLDLNINMFISLYTNSFSKLINIDGVEPTHAFRALSSRADTIGRVSSRWLAKTTNESHEFSDFDVMEINDLMFSNEKDKKEDDVSRVKIMDRSGKEVKEPSILNRHINVTIIHKGKDLMIPIIIRANVVVVSTNTIRDYVSTTTDRAKFSNSWDRVRAKVDSFNEFIFAKKLIREDRERIMNDEYEVIDMLKERKTRAFANNAATLNGFGGSYGALIISSEEKRIVNLSIRGNIDKEQDKDLLLERIGSFNMCIMNEGLEVVQVYTSDIKPVSSIKFGKLKSKGESDVLTTLVKSIGDSSKIRL